VLHQGFGTHDSVHIGLVEILQGLLTVSDAPIFDHRNLHETLDFFDDVEVSATFFVLLLLLGPPVHCNEGYSSLGRHLAEVECLVFNVKLADLNAYRNA